MAAWAEQPPIIISSGRSETYSVDTAASISVVERQEILDSAAPDLAGLLRGRAGLDVRDSYGDGASAVIDMRGFGATAGSNTLILMDGRRLNNSSDLASPDLGGIDLADVERVEIVQGSAGTLFGNQAVGGVVNIITRRPEESGLRIQTGIGGFDGYELGAQWADRWEIGPAYQVSAHKQESDNYRANNHSNREHLSLRLDPDYGGGRMFLEQQVQRDELQLPGALFRDEMEADRRQSAPAYRGDFSDTETLVSRIGLRQALGPAWSLEADLSYRDNDRRFQTSFRAFPGTLATQTRRVWGLNPRLSGRIPLAGTDLKLTLGSDLESTDYRLRTAFGPQGETQDSYALYGQLGAAFDNGWSTTLGLRHAGVHNRIDNAGNPLRLDDGVTVGSAGLVFEPLPSWRLFARWDQSYRFATVDEHTNIVTGQPAGLRNQTGDSYELGAAYNHGSLRARALGYQLDLRNEIGFDSSTFFNVNLAGTRRQGAIMELAWSPTRTWTLGSDYTYTDSRITAGPFVGRNLPLVPRHGGQLFVDYATSQAFGLRVAYQWTGERTLGGDFANAFAPLASYGVMSASARYHTGPWQLGVRVDNLLDRAYSETGAVGFDEAFTRRDAYFPAPERTFWLTLRYAPSLAYD